MLPDVRRQYTRTDLIWHQEDFSAYGLGGYHTVTLGDRLSHDRYIIRHKLGWGAFATVWLAKDTRKSHWVAIKIIRADKSVGIRKHKDVLSFLSRNPEDLENSFINPLLDHFTLHGPNGTHLCLVSEMLGPTLYQVVDGCQGAAHLEACSYYDFLKPQTIVKITRQLLEAVSKLHEYGYVHGDISTKNLAFTTRQVAELGETEFFENLDIPRTETITRRDGQPLEKGIPSQLVAVTRWGKWMDESTEDIRLIDFDGSFPQVGPKPKIIYQPGQFRAPETFLANEIDSRSDLWSLGIVLYVLIFSYEPIFGAKPASSISQIVKFVGNFPPEWQPLWDKLEDKQEESIDRDLDAISNLEEKAKTVRSRTLKPLIPVLRGLLQMRPSDRMTAEQALEMIAAKPRKAPTMPAVRSSPRRLGLRKRDLKVTQ